MDDSRHSIHTRCFLWAAESPPLTCTCPFTLHTGGCPTAAGQVHMITVASQVNQKHTWMFFTCLFFCINIDFLCILSFSDLVFMGLVCWMLLFRRMFCYGCQVCITKRQIKNLNSSKGSKKNWKVLQSNPSSRMETDLIPITTEASG